MKIIVLHSEAMAGAEYERIYRLVEELGFEIVGAVRADGQENFSNFNDYVVYPLKYIFILKWDLILIPALSDNIVGVAEHFSNIGISAEKLVDYCWLLKQKMIRKYEDINDPVIQETLKYWETNPLTIFNQHFENVPDTFNEVFIDDSNGLPYILFETVEGKMKKMYHPKLILNGLNLFTTLLLIC